jgi:hypothetical protein
MYSDTLPDKEVKMSHNVTESALWQQAADKIVGELHQGVDKALSEAASRGYAAPPGDTLAVILGAGMAAKGKLTEENSKIYEARKKIIFEQDLFAMELIVKISKLAMTLYASELINALLIENAEKDALRDKGSADVIRLNAEVDLRQRAIIEARATMEQRITVLKQQLVDAEEGTLVYEAALINAQIKTAEEKLRIIEYLYQIIAAEQVVLAAENRRIETLTRLLAAELIVAGVKREMVPFYIEKAGARVLLAEAIKAEIPIRRAIEELGYARIELKDTEEAAKHLLRSAENELERGKEELTRQDKATMLARTQATRLLQEYANAVRASILDKKEALDKDGISLRLDTSLERHKIAVDGEVELTAQEILNLTEELLGGAHGNGILQNLQDRANAHVGAIKASGRTREQIVSTSERWDWKTIN